MVLIFIVLIVIIEQAMHGYNMEIYLVGGAIRDELLNLPVHERDWVVVGSTPDQLLKHGFRPVGKDFPVFLHPETHEEYALARTERKTAPGYHGFSFHAAPEITLEDDLRRRDLTINAMARNADGQLIDPYYGARDLEQRWLRHVSSAFAEDPVRILRLARFSARYASLGFRVAPETLELAQRMVASGEVDHLVPERVWAETVRALGEARPERFFETLRDCGALARVFPEIDQLFGVPQPPAHHPEIDTGVHTLMALRQAANMGADVVTRFAVLVHDLGKGTTPHSMEPHHYGHEERGLAELARWNARGRLPRLWVQCAALVIREHMRAPRLAKPGKIVALLLQVEQSPLALDDFLAVIRSDHGPLPAYLEQAAVLLPALQAVSGRDCPAGLRGAAVGQWVREAQVRVCQAILPQLESAGK